MKLAGRIESLPPYLFAEIDKKIQAKRAAGVDVISFGVGDLFSLVKDAIPELLAGWGKAFALRQAKLLFHLGNAFAQLPVS